MFSLIIVFAIAGFFWFLGARYAVANRASFRSVQDRIAAEEGASLETAQWWARQRLFRLALWRVIWDPQSRLLSSSSDPVVEGARLEAVTRLRTYVTALAVFGGVFVILLVIVLVILGVRALAT